MSRKRQTSVRLSELSDRQLTELSETLNMRQTDLIAAAIDRIYQDEIYRARIENLSAIAVGHNYASAGQFLDAVISGEVATVLLADEPRAAAIRELRRQAETSDNHLLRETFGDIANALLESVRREWPDGDDPWGLL